MLSAAPGRISLGKDDEVLITGYSRGILFVLSCLSSALASFSHARSHKGLMLNRRID